MQQKDKIVKGRIVELQASEILPPITIKQNSLALEVLFIFHRGNWFFFEVFYLC